MGQTKYLDREIPTISLANFDSRIDEITRELVKAAEHVGFFCIVSYSSSKGNPSANENTRLISLVDFPLGQSGCEHPNLC